MDLCLTDDIMVTLYRIMIQLMHQVTVLHTETNSYWLHSPGVEYTHPDLNSNYVSCKPLMNPIAYVNYHAGTCVTNW